MLVSELVRTQVLPLALAHVAVALVRCRLPVLHPLRLPLRCCSLVHRPSSPLLLRLRTIRLHAISNFSPTPDSLRSQKSRTRSQYRLLEVWVRRAGPAQAANQPIAAVMGRTAQAVSTAIRRPYRIRLAAGRGFCRVCFVRAAVAHRPRNRPSHVPERHRNRERRLRRVNRRRL